MAKILVSPLGWGIGHATRDIPIIKELLKHGHQVDTAANGRSAELLKQEFPKLKHYILEDYPFPPFMSRLFIFKFTMALPTLLNAVRNERKNAEKLIKENKYDMVISDNRLGVFSRDIPSFIISHQLRFSTPRKVKFLEPFTQVFNAYYHKRFDKIIVPDNPFNVGSLSGKLSKSRIPATKKKTYFAGVLTSVEKFKVKEDIDYLIVLSKAGIELESKLFDQVQGLAGRKVIVLGKPGKRSEYYLDKDTLVKNYAGRKEMNKLMNRARFIITRTGYTTIMELAELEKKKALLIPIPNQTEQQYLSRYYKRNKWFYSVSQYKLNLSEDIRQARKFNGLPVMPKSKENARRLYEEVFSKYLKD